LIFTVLFGVAAFRAQADGFLGSYDRQIVASCMVLEAGGEGSDGMQAVLNVILNRSNGDMRRMVPETVKTGAFSCMSSVWRSSSPDYSPLISRAMNQPGSYEEALQLISTMEQGLLTDNTGGATHYHADYIRPYWVSSMRYLTTIGRHIFYVERGREVASL
jgi:spore germination cell wall hydrolase CwlJ-like protein